MKLIRLITILLVLLFGCDSSNPGNRINGSGGGDRTGNGGSDDSVRSEYCLSESQIPSCGSSNCCKDEEECEDKCDDFFDSTAERLCHDLPLDEGTRLLRFADNLEDANADDFTNEDLTDFGLFMSIGDIEAFEKIVRKEYSVSDNKKILRWLAEEDKASEILFCQNNSDVVQILEMLLSDDTSGDQNVLDGLRAVIEDGESFLELAAGDRNDKLVKFVHNKIIRDELCQNKNVPEPNVGGSTSPTTNQEDDNDYGSGDEEENAEGKAEAACVLGVYCDIFRGTSKDSQRREIARLVNDGDVEDLIESDIADGGLGDVDNPNDWTNTACERLDDLWINSNALNLNL